MITRALRVELYKRSIFIPASFQPYKTLLGSSFHAFIYVMPMSFKNFFLFRHPFLIVNFYVQALPPVTYIHFTKNNIWLSDIFMFSGSASLSLESESAVLLHQFYYLVVILRREQTSPRWQPLMPLFSISIRPWKIDVSSFLIPFRVNWGFMSEASTRSPT